jgi:hypothetical protein
MDIRIIERSRAYIKTLKRDNAPIRDPFMLFSPIEFAKTLHCLYLILYLSLDSENEFSSENNPFRIFIANVSERFTEQLHISCKKGELEEYLEYVYEIAVVLSEHKNYALVGALYYSFAEYYFEYHNKCLLFKKLVEYLSVFYYDPEIIQKYSNIEDTFELNSASNGTFIEQVKVYIITEEDKCSINPDSSINKIIANYIDISKLYVSNHEYHSCITDKCNKVHPNLSIQTENLKASPSKSTSSLSSLSASLKKLFISPKKL